MNEREFVEFYRYLASRVATADQDNEDKQVDLKAKFDHEYLINIMWEVLGLLDKQGHALTRVSMHAINFHFLCFDRSVWRSGKLSVISSIDVSLQIAGGYSPQNFTSILNQLERLRFNFPESLTIKTKQGTVFRSKEDLVKEPVFSFFYGTLR